MPLLNLFTVKQGVARTKSEAEKIWGDAVCLTVIFIA